MPSFPSAVSVAATSPIRRRGETVALALLLAVGGWFYFWTATSAGSPLTWERPHYDLYNRLADGFLAGRTSFIEEPPPELAMLANPYDPAQNAPYSKYHDVSYYRGRYYLYFGPTPAVLLLVPWKALTGQSMPQNLAVVVFAWGAALAGVLILKRLRDLFFTGTPAWMLLFAAALATFGNLLPVLLRRPLYYELAIASAVFCSLAALLFLLQAETGTKFRTPWLAAAGLALGFAVAGRPSQVFSVMAVLAVVGWSQWRAMPGKETEERLRNFLRPALALGVPFGSVMMALMAYNYARFGSVTEFGTSYMLAGSSQLGVSQFSVRYLPINLYYHLVALPHLGGYFPFLLVTGFPPISLPAGYAGQENLYGIIATLPVLCGLLPLWQALKPRAAARTWQPWARAAVILGLGNLAMLLFLMGGANRHQLDYVPALTMVAVLGCWHLDAALSGWHRTTLRATWAVAVAFTLGFNLLVSLQHNELFKHHNPPAYARLAMSANRFAEALSGLAEKSGPMRIEFTLPQGRTALLEPLVVTGWSFRADFLYVYYKDERHIQIGFEHTSYGGPMSTPIQVDYAVPQVLEVEMGSLYPPREHPYWDGRSPEEVERLKRLLRIKLNGQLVHEGLHDFYDSSPGDVSVGRNHVSDAFGRKFTGVILNVERPAGRR